jgi:protein involved in polysaccharide export with SLBB domain
MRATLILLAALALAAPAAAAQADEAVRPGDVVRLRIWQEPELSGEFPVNESGTVVLPKLGPVETTGATHQQLRERLVEGFGQFLTHNSIDVTVLRRIQVLGAVRSPGLYPVDGTMTVADVLALAGGTANDARPDRILLVRGDQRVDVRLSGGQRIADTPIRSGDQLFVPQRRWLDRNAGVMGSVLSTGAGLVIGIF